MTQVPDRLVALLATPSIPQLLAQASAATPNRVYAVDAAGPTTICALNRRVRSTARQLQEAGVRRGSRVAVALGNSVGHIAVVFAVLELDAVWVPLNTRLRGDALRHQLHDSAATHLVAAPGGDLVSALSEVRGVVEEPAVVLQRRTADDVAGVWRFDDVSSSALAPNVSALMYTSGTTGPAKGVQVTAQMLLAAALGCIEVAEPSAGDVFYVWEPLFHIGGAQLMVLPLLEEVTLALARGLSVSRFWDEVAACGATHIHHLGGVLQMLLNAPAHPAERAHKVRITWGAGATEEVWRAVRERFGLNVHECYGMTETSSIVTVNKKGPEHGIGHPLPWFEVRVDASSDLSEAGEVEVRAAQPDLITPGYVNNEQATAKAWSGPWWRTGDVGCFGHAGSLHFVGRGNDSIRVRGENVSAWQVESVFSSHASVDQCAAIGVRADVGEQEIKLFVVPIEGAVIDPNELVSWARERMPSFQLPRYVRIVSSMPMTPSRRVAKKELPTHLDGAVDLRATVRA